jgi:sugar phosphate isomerase/epimerase
VRQGIAWGIRRYEIRCLESGRVPFIDGAEWKEAMHILREEGVRVSALSPGLFKLPLSDTEGVERQMRETLPRAIDMAHEAGAGLIIAFGFQRSPGDGPGDRERVAARLRRAAEFAERGGILLAVENEPGYWCDSGVNSAEMIELAASPALRANWDPANAFGCGESPFPDGYARIRPHIAGVHAKDTRAGSLVECLPIGEGALDWRGQIGMMRRDGLLDLLTIETHCLPLAEQSKRNMETLMQYIRESDEGANG